MCIDEIFDYKRNLKKIIGITKLRGWKMDKNLEYPILFTSIFCKPIIKVCKNNNSNNFM